MWKVLGIFLCTCVLAISACTITLPEDIKGFSPVILTKSSPKSGYGLFRPTGKVSKFAEGSVLQFVCTGKNNLIESLGGVTAVELKCSDGQFVDGNNNAIALNTLVCKSIPESTLQITDNKCSNDRGVIYEAGIMVDQTFHRVFEICYDKKSETTFYTHNTLYGAAIKYNIAESTRRKFLANGMKFKTNKVNDLYTKKNQLKVFEKDLGKQQTFLDEKKNFLSRGHLSPDADFMFGYEQLSTYYYANVAPQFQPINGGNWLKVEDMSRALAGAYGENIESYNGYFGIVKLPKSDGTIVNMFLDHDKEFPIPQYNFKVLMHKSDDAAVVFVTVNNPFVTDAKSTEVCKNVCAKANLEHVDFPEVTKGYTFCCTLAEFKKVFNGLPKEVQGKKLLTRK